MMWYLNYALVIIVVSKQVKCNDISENTPSNLKVGNISEDSKEKPILSKACSCGQYGLCEFNEFQEKICTCEYGFAEKEGICRECDCNLMSRRFNGINCTFQDGRKQCSCPSGFRTTADFCQDIDECRLSNPCPVNTVCINKPGTFDCRCREGFKPIDPALATGVYECEDINECFDLPCQKPLTRCFNSPGSYDCVCAEGHYSSSSTYGSSYRPAHNTCYEKATQWREAMIALTVIFSVFILGITSFIKAHQGST